MDKGLCSALLVAMLPWLRDISAFGQFNGGFEEVGGGRKLTYADRVRRTNVPVWHAPVWNATE